MITISLCMIVKNEEKNLARCLLSVGEIADEIIIVDTGSSDKTREIAEEFTDKIYDFVWCDDFSKARNFAFEKANMDYQLWLDADDVILPEDKEKFMNLKRTLSADTDAIMMWYNTGFDSEGRVIYRYYRERLFKREKGFHWVEPVHECVIYSGSVLRKDIAITHKKDYSVEEEKGRNLSIYEQLLKEGQVLSPRGEYYYSRELKDNGYYDKAVQSFSQYLDSGMGWREDNINACLETAKCLQILGRNEEAVAFLYKSFYYDLPRAEICCEIGYYFKQKGGYKKAIFWFEMALKTGERSHANGFVSEDCKIYIPALEIAVCYDYLGETIKAMRYNDLAGVVKPNSQAYLHNKDYFRGKLR